MCGIVGAVSSGPINSQTIIRMRDRLMHRGPDDSGLWSSPNSLVALGFRRLAIIDLSAEANQPFISYDNRFVIVFNGEIYNFKSLRTELIATGARFRTQSDTEVLVEAFRKWGKQCLDHLSGMFAFAIWDSNERTLFCARDRSGEKPFYYTTIGQSFVFASEPKALLPWPGFRRELDFPALIDFLTFGFVVDPKCIWQGCSRLPAGHWMSINQTPEGNLVVSEPRAYWDLEFDPDHALTEWRPRIREELLAASREMANADVPVGAFLSGGVDSSSVVAALSQIGRTVNTFTIGFDEAGFDERRWAREVSIRYRTTHTEKRVVAQDMANVFRKLLWHYDEPFNDYSYLPSFYLCSEARKTIVVALSGDGGDEVFAGYRKYERLSMREDIERFIPHPIRGIVAGCSNALFSGNSPWSRTMFQHGADRPALMLDMLTLGFPLAVLRRAARGRLAQALQHYRPMDVVESLMKRAPSSEVGLINTMRYLDFKLTLGGGILVKIDRASMAVALEVRPVYLNRRLLDLAAKIPPGLLADRRRSKKILKEALRPWLSATILNRPKMGLAMPLREWMSTAFPAAEPRRTRLVDELIDPALLPSLTELHATGGQDLTARIHSLILLDHWLDRWLEGGGDEMGGSMSSDTTA
jgi:asparagine synthase (glutamine-hydrolysing)